MSIDPLVNPTNDGALDVRQQATKEARKLNSELLRSEAAVGDRHPQVPAGFTAVAVNGTGGVRRWFLVEAAQYVAGMTVDPQQHRELAGFVPYTLVRGGGSERQAPAAAGGVEQPDFGTALPWSQIHRDLGFKTASQAPPAGRDSASGSVAGKKNDGWSDVIEQINGEARSSGQHPIQDQPGQKVSGGALPWREVMQKISGGK